LITIEQQQVETPFEVGNMPAYRGLRGMQLCGRAAEVAMPGGRFESLQGAAGWNPVPFFRHIKIDI
jgi:hypothetical protein